MENTHQYRSRRERERHEAKKTAGYKLWVVMFTLFYPVIAVFTFLFSGVLMVFSAVSRAVVFLLGKVYARS
ncbi:hypothetical protein GCM10023091_21340 [Ravibacter arvi]|uniref:Uncharacterized protein n=1 Tax=Ravibacter arvi TaxID=2051041 RepID=A0ABP8LZ39_9BACT